MSNNEIKLNELDRHLCLRVNEAKLFTNRFSSFSKSDYEILMFTIFLDSYNGPVRDYDVGIALGLTESKVRNLRVKSQLIYPKNLKWEEELAFCIRHGHYDPNTRDVTITFENPSVQNLVKNQIEKGFGTVGRSFNSKQLILPLESFLLLAAYAEDNEEEILKELTLALKKEDVKADIVSKKDLRNKFLAKR